MQLALALVVRQRCGEFPRAMNATAIHDHHDLLAGFAKDVHDLMGILAELLRIKVGHNLVEDFRGAILDGADDAEQHPAGDAAPGAMLQPRLTFETFSCLMWCWLSGRMGRRARWA